MEEKAKKEFVGKVVSDKNNKTITVLVETYKTHPLYKKRVKSSKKYCVHDESNKAKKGDKVKTPPIEKALKLKKELYYRRDAEWFKQKVV